MKSWLVLFFAVASIFAAEPAPPVGEKFVYKKVGEREMRLYVSKPTNWKSTDQRPAIVGRKSVFERV